MKGKFFYVCGALLIGIAACVSVWFFLREHNRHQLQGFSSRHHKGEITENRNILQQGHTHDEARIEKLQSQIKSQIMSMQTEEQLADPDRQKRLAVYDSPEFLEFLKASDPTELDQRKLNDFWESQGFSVKREYPEMFRKVFPTGEPEDYDPEMRLKIAKMFLAADPVDLTDPETAFRQRRKVISKLMAKDNTDPVWYLSRFGEEWDGPLRMAREGARRNAAREWMIDVQRNAASIVAAEAAGVDVPKAQGAAPSWDLSSVMESSSDSHSETEMSTTLDTSERTPMTDAEIEAPIEKSFTPQAPNIPTYEHPKMPEEIQSNLETALKAQFTSARFERAMSTLERYGPEEGLRHLRESDPEVANQIEQHRRREEVSR